MRADAVRSREQLLKAAAEVFAEQGTETSIAEIAQRAGVGKGTVFRHFASKDELVAAIVCGIIDDLVVTVEGLAESDPMTGLSGYMTAMIDLQARNRAFCEVAYEGSALDHPSAEASRARLLAAVDVIADRARAAGVIKPGITGEDLMALLSGIHHAAAPRMAAEPELNRRYLAVVLDGLSNRLGS
ncbi:TetR/AcrR family transcriptional regulator [Kibdelosporangium philippinense]|uniref:TetR/AcrR family transcriptional regulator n=1 Tax=Kibdelosporangium philippinense TaxID=211113 RepID=A0ABS8ZUA9_9PSEU|nr:TetR/AcrR family transcriptional regulator [Kibdelosporangium philippinense]MCE7010813.1 TetR/AcrR family transcriptional regulator [Kibdelosporangium philippinense]